ncbi:MAG: replication restart helicase PriA, partial [Chloroflexota bacterium]
RTPRTSAGQAGVRIVDMRRELIEGHTGMFSRILEYEMTEALRAGGRVILFLNRRGSASFLQCRRCGAVPSCRRCDTALTLHRGEGADQRDSLVCHYCGYSVRPPRACEVCGDERLRPMGLGTQAVAAEARKLFPGADVLRWDRDTARSASQHFDLLDRFLEGNSRILVGTQMVAKGLDIPEVTLVGVVLADIGLAVPDFRAGERAFQVLTQVAGRAGRGQGGGAAIIQTFQPDHYAVQAAAEQDYEAFYETETALRAEHADPPFTRLVKLSYSDYDTQRSWDEAKRMADALNQERLASGDTGVEVLGPSPSFPHRMRGLVRWHVLLKGAQPESLLDRVPPGRDWVVDVDPITVS